jgi:predicted nuclease of predicted toxin-antitoxin system
VRFKIDENLPSEFADLLRSAGHDAETVLDEGLGGQSDATISKVCSEEKRVLVTLDLDFSNVRAYPPGEYCGLIVFRLRRQDTPYVLNVFRQTIDLLEREPIDGLLWIVEENRVRVRA